MEAGRVLDKSSKDFAEALMYFSPINKTPWALKQAQSMIHPICDLPRRHKTQTEYEKTEKKKTFITY